MRGHRRVARGRSLSVITATALGATILVAAAGGGASAATGDGPSWAKSTGAIRWARAAESPRGGLSASGKVTPSASSPWVEDCYDQPVGEGTITPELVAACMIVERDDGATDWDDSEDLWFESYTDGPTNSTDQATVYVETTGDDVPELALTAPAMPQVGTLYSSQVERWQGGAWVPTGQEAGWWRTGQAQGGDGYTAVFGWRALAMTKARFSFDLTKDDTNWTAVPDPFVGNLVTLPKAVAPSPPRNVVATPGDGRATVRWARPANPGTSPITRYTVTSVPGGRTCVTSGATSCVVTGLRNQQPYRFRVRALSVAGASALSAPSAPVVPKPFVRIKVGTRSNAGKLWVDVNPNQGKGYWTFTVQKRTPAGTWVNSAGPYRTKGAKETRTVNLPKGTYRVVVGAKYGYQATTSASVTLRK